MQMEEGKNRKGPVWLLSPFRRPPDLTGIPTVVDTLYCLLIWAPQVDEFSWFNLDISLICWTYCSTGHSVLAYLAVAAGSLSVLGGLTYRRFAVSRYILAVTGLLLLPLGLVNFIVVRRS